MKKWEEKSGQIWCSWPLSLFFVLLSAGAAIWALCKTPSPGVAIGILGAVAVVMTIRPQMRFLQHAVWLVIITTLLIAEVRSIRKNDSDVASARKEQQLKLETLNTESETIIGDLKTTLAEVDQTLRQTQPHATVRFQNMAFGDKYNELKVDTLYTFNYAHVNDGAENAVNLKKAATIYVGKHDDKKTELIFAQQFEKGWPRNAEVVRTGFPPNIPSFSTIHKAFTLDEMKQLADATIYYFVRFEYSDSTGKWRSDTCGQFQMDKQLNPQVAHGCAVFTNFRYSATPTHR